ncbi:MAG: hypothetical protein IPN76_16635 [Saprospiraceae bacterium]|nr:hypothetical protein [Saprospiraceae bacterium]
MEKQSDVREYGTYIAKVNEESHRIFHDKIRLSREITHVLPVVWKLPKNSIALFSLDGKRLHYACIMKKGYKVATGGIRVKMNEFVSLTPPIAIEEISSAWKSDLELPFSDRFEEREIPWRLWQELYEQIKKMREQQRLKLDRLERIVNGKNTRWRKSSAFSSCFKKKTTPGIVLRETTKCIND